MTTFKLLSAAAIAAISLSATAFAADTATAPAATVTHDKEVMKDGTEMTTTDATTMKMDSAKEGYSKDVQVTQSTTAPK